MNEEVVGLLSMSSYMSYLILVQFVLGTLLNLWTLFAFAYLLMNYAKTWTNVMMRIFAVSSTLFGFFGFIHQGHQVVFWRPEPAYNAYSLFYTGIGHLMAMEALHVSTFYLCIDRIVAVAWPQSYRWSSAHSLMPVLFLLTLVAANGVVLVVDYVPSYPQSPHTTCLALNCLVDTNGVIGYTSVRTAFACLNVSATAIFYILLRRQGTIEGGHQRYHRLVLYTMSLSLIIDCIPQLIALFMIKIVGINPGEYLGAWSALLISTDAFCCACMYSRSHRHKATAVTTMSTTRTVT